MSTMNNSVLIPAKPAIASASRNPGFQSFWMPAFASMMVERLLLLLQLPGRTRESLRRGGFFMIRLKLLLWSLNVFLFLVPGQTSLAAEKLVGLQSAPSIAMALPWFAEEARLYPKYDLDFQLVYIASSGIVTAAMSGGNGSVAI